MLGTSAATESKAEAHYTTPHTTDRSSPSTARPPVPIDASLECLHLVGQACLATRVFRETPCSAQSAKFGHRSRTACRAQGRSYIRVSWPNLSF